MMGAAGAADALTRGLAKDLAPIRANCVSPGYVKTPVRSLGDHIQLRITDLALLKLWEGRGIPQGQLEAIFADHAKKLPCGYVSTPEDIAHAYIFLMK
jgi:NAD(P)-dependent dehydrogenase (short-subunit alcohol dehydrogenase family)